MAAAGGGWDVDNVYSANQGLGANDDQGFVAGPQEGSFAAAKDRFRAFLQSFRNGNTYVYRDQLRHHVALSQFYVDVDVDDLVAFDEELSNKLTKNPADYLPLVSTENHPSSTLKPYQLLLVALSSLLFLFAPKSAP